MHIMRILALLIVLASGLNGDELTFTSWESSGGNREKLYQFLVAGK